MTTTMATTTTQDKGWVLSFDLGESATAYCLGTRCGTVIGVGIAALGHITNAMCAVIAMTDLYRRLPKVGLYLVEEQPGINRRTSMLEAALAAVAGAGGAAVVHTSPLRVAKHYDTSGLTYAAKKRKAVLVVDGMIARGELMLKTKAEHLYTHANRRHDIADAILQYTWFIRVGLAEIGTAGLRPGVSIRACDARLEEKRATARSTRALELIDQTLYGKKKKKRQPQPSTVMKKKKKQGVIATSTAAATLAKKKKWYRWRSGSGHRCQKPIVIT